MRTSSKRRRALPAFAAVLALSAALAVGCGSSDTPTDAESADLPTTTTDPAKGSSKSDKQIPKALAANREQAGQILEEGSLEAKLDELRGHPIVVNQWASWCPPCREEFPYFRDSAERHAAEVAFVGIDMQDDAAAAQQFLTESPVPYPSIDDPDAKQIASLGGGIVSPTTVFIDEQGEVVKVFQGAYANPEQLEADIEQNLLG